MNERDNSLEAGKVPVQLALQGQVHFTVSYKTAMEHCCLTLLPTDDPTLKTTLLQERRTQFKKKEKKSSPGEVCLITRTICSFLGSK